ncbi:MAG: OmpA family protein [Gemmatimonadales bacterium]
MKTGWAAALAMLAGLVIPEIAESQSGAGGQIELGTFGTLASYDSASLGLAGSSGGGGRLGWHLTRMFGLELSGDYVQTQTNQTGQAVNVSRIGGTFLAHASFIPLGTPYVGAGFDRMYYRGAFERDDSGWHLLVGDRLSLGGRAAIRIEGRAGADNLAGSIGISVYAFGGPPRDSDKDRVADKDDRCPDTPMGAMVDTAGCPTDQDADGAFDGLDNCPDTPRGALVNEVGCPSDGDLDTVYDGIDLCPNTSAGAAVDQSGCPLDSDGDSVFDGLDQCPATPQGATVDAGGCPLDGDRDGVFDGLDQCPDTPPGTPVTDTGCTADSDGDGVLDTTDQCPDTPAGTPVDEMGCPADSDGDGVSDGIDRCPNTLAGQSVDAVGCPILFVVEQGVRREEPLVLEGVNFQSGRSVLTEESFAILDGVAASLLAHPEVRIEIGGHTDASGRRRTNMRLSRERAQAVKAYLASKGVDPGRMEAVGYGPDYPIETNDTPQGRAANRRVELKVLEQGQPER